MNLSEILCTYNREVAYLLSERDNVNALYLCDELYNYLKFHPKEKTMINYAAFRILLLNYISTLLNSAQLRKAETVMSEYEMLKKKCSIIEEEELKSYIKLKIHILSRLGFIHDALQFIDHTLNSHSVDSMKTELLYLKAQLKSEVDYPSSDFSAISEALGEAEAESDEKRIVQCYLNLAKVVCLKYPALAVYFTRKAEILSVECEENNCIAKLDRALCSFIIYQNSVDKEQDKCFSDEANELLAAVEPKTRNNQFLYNYYLLRKGVIENDVNVLLELLKFYQEAEALREVCRICDLLVRHYINHKDWEAARKYNSLYVETASGLGENLKVEQAKELGKKLSEEIPSIVYNPFEIQPNAKGYFDILDILENIVRQEEYYALDKSPLRQIMPYHEQEGKCEVIRMEDDTCKLFPLGLIPSIYYRGQSAFYELSKPTIHRNLSDSEIFVERLKYAELKILIDTFPLSKMYEGAFSATLGDGTQIPLFLSVDHLALAQHYGIKTELMDFTTDKFVAAFFATTKYDAKTDTYSPIIGGEGVFYKYFDMPGFTPFRPVGIQPFTRPGEQRGYVLPMSADENLNQKCQYFKFRHNEAASQLIFNYVNRGNKLFPYDILEEKARIIKESSVFCEKAYDIVKEEFYKNASNDVLQDYMRQQGITLQSSPIVAFSKEEEGCFFNYWNNGGKKKFCDKILVRSVRAEPIDEASKNDRT